MQFYFILIQKVEKSLDKTNGWYIIMPNKNLEEIKMITTLHIKNIGIIDEINIDLNAGFNVLTGETGSGKTLIMDSLAILAGGRFSKEMIRRGEEYSYVELCLYLPNNPRSVDGNIIVSREIYANGRNLCKINGRLVTVNELKNFMEDKMDIHGQHENQTLFNTAFHVKLLDEFAGKEVIELKKDYQENYQKVQEMKKEIQKNYGDEKEKKRKLDLLTYQKNEIEMAHLKAEEEEEIEIKRKRMLHAEKIAGNLNVANQAISTEAIESMGVGLRSLEKIASFSSEYEASCQTLREIYYTLQELARDIGNFQENIELDEGERRKIEERLDTIFSLKSKYGNTIEEILHYKEEIKEEIEKIENAEEYVHNLKKMVQEKEMQMQKQCEKLHQYREKAARDLEKKIKQELEDLEMKNACFLVQITETEEFTIEGKEKIEFQMITNIGEMAKPLTKIASGGEISRIMLAIKKVLADVDEVPVLIFDEIDTGISGKAASSVAEKMKEIAKKHQVLCVTHLASIAAKGDYNYYIHKIEEQGTTKTKIETLDEEEVIKEIARIATGELTAIALEHARQLRIASNNT